MLGYEEKLERIELIDAVRDAGRLARGLDQLLESLAHADQLDPLDVEGVLALRSISERCAARIGDPNRRNGQEAESDVRNPVAACLEAVRPERRRASRRNPMQLDELSDN